MSDPAYVSPIPPIGLSVQWYEHGNRNDRKWPAFVLEPTDRGITSLIVMRRDGFPKSRQTVMHISNPALNTQSFETKSERGAWDYIPGFVIDMTKSGNVSQEDRVTNLERQIASLTGEMQSLRSQLLDDPDMEERILKAAALHPNDSRKVAELVGCAIQKVTAVLRKTRKAQEDES